MGSRTDRVAEVVAAEVTAGALAVLARYHGRRVRDLDPVLVEALRAEILRKQRLHLPRAVLVDRDLNTPIPLSPELHQRLKQHAPMGERDTLTQDVSRADIARSMHSEPARESTMFGADDEITRPGRRLPDGVARSSSRPTKPSS